MGQGPASTATRLVPRREGDERRTGAFGSGALQL